MKIVAMVMIVAILLNAMAPALAHAATYLQGAEINTNTLIRDAYVAVTYRDSNDQEKTEKGWIDAVGETSFTIRSGGLMDKKPIAYDKVLSVVMSDESTVPAKQMNEVNRFMREMREREIREAEQAAIQQLKQRLKEKFVTIGQFDLSKKEWYVHVAYTSQKGRSTATGQIFEIHADHCVITVRERNRALNIRKTIAYRDIDTLVVAQDPGDIEIWRQGQVTLGTKWVNQKTVTIMSQGQIDSPKITTGWYAHVVYTSKEGVKRTITGRIVNKDATGISVTDKMKTWTIAYNDIDILIVAKDMQDILRDISRYRPISTQDGARVRVYAPSISKRRMVGRLIWVTQDTFIIQYEQDFLIVPLSSLSTLEVRLRQRNTSMGILIGIGLGLGSFWVANKVYSSNSEPGALDIEATLAIVGFTIYVAIPICILSTLIGAMTKSDKWVEVSPQSLNLSLVPTPTKGLRAALTFNF